METEGSTDDAVAEVAMQDMQQTWQRQGIQPAYKRRYRIKPAAKTQRNGELQQWGADDAAIPI